MATIYESYTEVGDEILAPTATKPVGQTFTPSLTFVLSSLKIRLRKQLNPGTVSFTIKEIDDSGRVGSSLSTATLNGDALTTSFVLTEITMPSAILRRGKKYIIILSGASTDLLNWVGMDLNSAGSYGTNSSYTSVDSGVTWTEYTGIAYFEAWGTAYNDPDGINRKFEAAMAKTIGLAGTQIRVRYFVPTVGSVYDDEVSFAQSGANLWTSGVIFSLNTRQGSYDSVLLQQGKIIDSDKKLYVDGMLPFNGSLHSVDIQLGSPTGDLYTTIEDGGNVKEVQGVPVYKKQFIRRLTGSLT